jgi:hypothetical protein
MKLLLTLLCVLSFPLAYAQDGQDEVIEEIPYVRILALDKGTQAAEAFNREVSSRALDYNLIFVDTENSPLIRYVYKTSKNESLRIDYKYVLESQGAGKPARRTVTFQRISGSIQVLTEIYNFLFNASISPKTVNSAATVASRVGHAGKVYTFTFQPDDYEPGYWVMTFVR